jgi:hypothetical protein
VGLWHASAVKNKSRKAQLTIVGRPNTAAHVVVALFHCRSSHKKAPALWAFASTGEVQQTSAVGKASLNQFAKCSPKTTCSYRAGAESRTFAPD